MDVRKVLDNAREASGYTRSELANVVNISGSRITEFLNDEESLPFDSVLKIVQTVLPNNEKEIMVAYMSEISKPKSLKYAIEYCSTNRLLEELLHLITENKNHDNKGVREFCKIYNLVYRWQTKDYESETGFYTEIRFAKTNEDSLKVLLLILESNILYAMKEYRFVKLLSNTIYDKLNTIKDQFLCSSFNVRLSEMVGYIELKINCDFEKTHEVADMIIENSIGSSFKGFGYFLKAMSEMHRDFNLSLNYFKCAISEYKQSKSFYSVNAMKRNASLLYYVWGKLNKEYEEGEIYNNILQNKYDETLNTLNEKGSDFKESPLGMYIEGCASNSKDLLYKSFSLSVEQGDNLTTLLPKTKLIQLDESEESFKSIERYMISA